MTEKATNYNEYKNKRKSIQQTLTEISQNSTKKEYPKDEKLFKYTRDSSGNAFIQIRFLPSRNQLPPLVPRYEHYFENIVGDKKRVFFDTCPTTIGNPCPLCESNRKAWQGGNEDLARKRARKSTWFVNIFVIKDSQTPDNNNKVFVWKIGKKIYEKIMAAMKPSDEDISAGKKPIDVFDLETGADFVVKVKNVAGFVNYDSSYFTDTKPLFKDEKEIESVFNDIYLLDEYIDPKNFKGSEEITKRLDYVNGVNSDGSSEEDEDEVETFKPSKKGTATEQKAPESNSSITEDDAEDLFKK